MIERREIITPNNEIYMPSRTFDSIKTAKEYSIANPNTICLAASGGGGKKVYPDYLEIVVTPTATNSTVTINRCNNASSTTDANRIFHEDCEIDWGDGKYDGVTKGTSRSGKSFSHTYIYPGTYHIKVYGAFWEEPGRPYSIINEPSSITSKIYGTYNCDITTVNPHSYDIKYFQNLSSNMNNDSLYVDIRIPTPKYYVSGGKAVNLVSLANKYVAQYKVDMSEFDFSAVFSLIQSFMYFYFAHASQVEVEFNDSLADIPWSYDMMICFTSSTSNTLRMVLPKKTGIRSHTRTNSEFWYNVASMCSSGVLDMNIPEFVGAPIFPSSSSSIYTRMLSAITRDSSGNIWKPSEIAEALSPTPPDSFYGSFSWFACGEDEWNKLDDVWKIGGPTYGTIA